MTIFILLVSMTTSNMTFSAKNLKEQQKIVTTKWIVLDLVWILNGLKVNYGTKEFTRIITKGDSDDNCNGNFPTGDISIRDYCFIYPYYDTATNRILFYNNTPLNIATNINLTEIISNNKDGYNSTTYLNDMGSNYQNTKITIALKQNFIDKDLFEWFVGVQDTITNEYIIKQAVTIK